MALGESKFERAPDEVSFEFDHVTKGPLTTLDIENSFDMDRDEIQPTRSSKIGRLAIWHKMTRAALSRDADKDMLEVHSGDITESPRSVSLGLFDSRKCEFSSGVESSSTYPWRIHWRCPCTHR